MHWTKTREIAGAIIALVFVIVFGTIVGSYFGLPIPFVPELLVKLGIM